LPLVPVEKGKPEVCDINVEAFEGVTEMEAATGRKR
jgi:hypothetical protein